MNMAFGLNIKNYNFSVQWHSTNLKEGKGEVGATGKDCMHLPDDPSVLKQNNHSHYPA